LSQTDIQLFGSREHENAAASAKQKAIRCGQLSDEKEINIEIHDQVTAGVVTYDHNGSVVVNSLTYGDFRQRLVEHFDTMYRNNKVL
jgi:hypothetical protein